MSHTKGLLAINHDRLESKDDHGWINDGWIIAQCQGPDAVTNARRLVACWNACLGYETEQLEDDRNLAKDAQLMLHEVCDVVKKNQQLIEERDELLAALRLADKAMNHMGDVLNSMDAVEDEDLDICTPAFEAVQVQLDKYKEVE